MPDQEIGAPQRAVSRGPSWRSSSSPAGWPKESLISLKRFEVDEQEGEGRAGSARPPVGEEGVEHLEQLAAVAEPGQLVGDRLAVALAG